MTIFKILGTLSHTVASMLLLVFVLLCSPAEAQSQTSNQPSRDQSATPFQLKVTSNLVVVRVVVRDGDGKPVEGLRKEDFKLFDRGKEQAITQFDVVSTIVPPTNSPAARVPEQTAPVSTPPAPGKYLALYFDDLNSSDADMIEARDAADRYLAANLQPQDRVAILTSDQVLSDFTSDPKQIHEALFKLHASVRGLGRTHYCPDLSDYQALQIMENNLEALAIASDEAKHCEGGDLVPPGGMASGGSSGPGGSASGGGGIPALVIRSLAQNIVNQSEIQARTNLQQLEQVVKRTSQMAGQRTIILVSPGFLSQNEQYQLDQLIDHALRSQVVISSLDPKGLAVLMREADASRSYIPAANPNILQAAHRMDSQRELVATAVLADIAQATGGEYFHNSNDLKGGFGALAGSPLYYILAFAPSDMKQDGKFHELKVTLAEKEKGLRIQARRGYFAPKEGEAVPEAPEARVAETKAAATDPESHEQDRIREAVLSKTEVQELPVVLEVKPAAGQGETRELSLSAHLDGASLHFRKEAERNLNTVTFVFAVFDEKDSLVNAQQTRARVNVLDAQLPSFIKNGVDVSLTFQLKPGNYRIREVVIDSEDQHLTTLSHAVTIQ
jgi:VWFA-related protein